ncbi:ABC transporter permease [Actinomyces wuliandei]|uniref:ABC transporter permease n=1 Tax=Actinomyces wuliandei TaxID=2057743 RepID=UPI000FDCD15D|nr:ABC transporter permease [Actinomyces wuliandei]
MRALGLEISKLTRSRLWLTLVLATGIELAWATAVLSIIITRSGTTGIAVDAGYAIGETSSVHTVVTPIISAVVASRLAAMEHDSTMLSQLLADGQPRAPLFLAKLTTAVTACSVPALALVPTATLVAAVGGVPADPGLTATWLGGLMVANIAMTAIHLALALLVRRQALTLAVGALGALSASLVGFVVPDSVATLLPWQYPALLVPVRMQQTEGTITGFVPVDHLGTYITIVIIVSLVATAVAQATFSRQVTR